MIRTQDRREAVGLRRLRSAEAADERRPMAKRQAPCRMFCCRNPSSPDRFGIKISCLPKCSSTHKRLPR
jgi:hypothetical protein